MAHAYNYSRTHYSNMTRQPLTDATNRVNNSGERTNTTARHREGTSYVQQQELKVNDSIQSHYIRPCSPTSIVGNGYDNKRLSVIAESQADSNRNSAISTESLTSGKGRRKTHVGPWQLGRTLGKGATGRVRLAKHAVTGQSAAIKIVSKKSAAMVQSESIAAMDRNAGAFATSPGSRPMPFGIEREVVIMKLIEHPNVINLYDVWENRGELYLVLEYVEGGELFDYVSTHGPLPEEEAVRIFRQIIAGLSYCHRYNICHRDLKPENILLDSRHNVKIADFGMAALQPSGHWLNTSCGSPHYAAPEIIYGRRYRGDKADIWSCGIILFALLTGYLPFDGGDLSSTLRLVKLGKYTLPVWLSVESADLIQRILQKRPEDRVTIQDMWNHPLLKKYETLHQAMSNHPLGPSPPLSTKDCGSAVPSRAEIDMELLRNLQTLWHCVKPEVLIEKLLSREPNHEKMFYNALMKFRTEQQENYQGQPLEYSASDYHHISRSPAASRAVARQSKNGKLQIHSHRRSQFSILADVGRYRNTQRDSKTIKPDSSDATSITITDRASGVPTTMAENVEDDEEDLFGDERLSSRVSNSSVSKTALPVIPLSPRKGGRDMAFASDNHCQPSSPVEIISWTAKKAEKSIQSKSSIAASRRPYSPAPVLKSAGYKRNVSFRHVRNRSYGGSSTKSRIDSVLSYHSISNQLTTTEHCSTSIEKNLSPSRHSSPSLPAQPTVVRTAGPAVVTERVINIAKIRDSSNYWKEEARKISNELSQICEEAFNRVSISTDTTVQSTSSSRAVSNSTATSVSVYDDEQFGSSQTSISQKVPDVASSLALDSCTTVREFSEIRRKLLQRSAQPGSNRVALYLADVISDLDRVIEHQKRQHDADQRRITSDPVQRFGEGGHLPAITEEILSPTDPSSSLKQLSAEVEGPRLRATGPTRLHAQEKRTTIRLVSRDSLKSIEEIKPLNIRKRNAPPPIITGTRNFSADSIRFPGSPFPEGHRSASPTSGSSRPKSRGLVGLEAIKASPQKSTNRGKVRGTSSEKKWSWFGKPRTPIHEEPLSDPRQDHGASKFDDRRTSFESLWRHQKIESDLELEKSDSSARKVSSPDKGKSGFLKLFSKRKSQRFTDTTKTLLPEAEQREDDVWSTHTVTTISNNSVETLSSQHQVSKLKSRHSPENQNWFARFFHVKPVTRAIALNVAKQKGLREIYRVLKRWKRYGMENVHLDKTENLIFGRVVEGNFLLLRPVDFSIELFTILERGRPVNLSVIRLRQERGAASSFHKVVDSLEIALRNSSLLVDDPVRSKKMIKVLDNLP